MAQKHTTVSKSKASASFERIGELKAQEAAAVAEARNTPLVKISSWIFLAGTEYTLFPWNRGLVCNGAENISVCRRVSNAGNRYLFCAVALRSGLACSAREVMRRVNVMLAGRKHVRILCGMRDQRENI
jgi:hypothetical protein